MNSAMNGIISSVEGATRILGVFAHPDDETFCAGGTFAKYIASGAEVMVVSATHGEAGQIRSPRIATRRTLGAIREQELHLACQRLGVQHTVCLDYVDGTLASVEAEVLTGRVVEIIRSFRPDVVITFGPDGGYGHPDHIAISTATTAAYQRSGQSDQFPAQLAAGLPVHQPARLFYSYFPSKRQSLLEQLVQWLMQSDKRFRGTLDFTYALLLFCEEASLLRYSSDHFDISWYPAGISIIEQGEQANSLYLILSGSVDVIRETDGGSTEVLARLEPGAFFGEEGLARRAPRNAHVVAAEHVTCQVFSPEPPTAFLGRGEDAHLGRLTTNRQDEGQIAEATTCIDVGPLYWLLRLSVCAVSALVR